MRTGRSLGPIYLRGVARFRRRNVDHDFIGKRAAACQPRGQPFDGKRMIYTGFAPILDS